MAGLRAPGGQMEAASGTDPLSESCPCIFVVRQSEVYAQVGAVAAGMRLAEGLRRVELARSQLMALEYLRTRLPSAVVRSTVRAFLE